MKMLKLKLVNLLKLMMLLMLISYKLFGLKELIRKLIGS